MKTKFITGAMIGICLALALSLGSVLGAASFQVTAFSCSPSEVALNNAFSCTATVRNVGDDDGSVDTATLYADSEDWLEDSNYPQSSGTSVEPGATTSIVFSNLKAVKSGSNGFSKVMLDSVTDLYVSNNNIDVNVIDVIVTVDNSVSSAAMSGEWTSTAEVTAGGIIDVSLTLTVNSGGCSIGSQSNPKTISDMNHGSKQSRTWTITQGTSGDCEYTISAAATGDGGVASKIDSTSSSIDCTNCPVPASGGSSGGGSSGGAGAGGGGSKTFIAGSLNSSAYLVELAVSDKVSFDSKGISHMLTLLNMSAISVRFSVESVKQIFDVSLENEVLVDFDGDNNADVGIKLKSVNIITNKATLMLRLVEGGVPTVPEGSTAVTSGGDDNTISSKNIFIIAGIIFLVLLAIISFFRYKYLRRRRLLRY